VDITEGINRQNMIHSCRSCNRFLCPPWQQVQLESKELLAACLRKIPGLSQLKLIDAVWIWTEEHSRRLKIKLTVQKEVMNGAVMQQAAIVEFAIRNQQCKNCEASYAQGVWHAVVQVRQRVSHKRTFFYLEQILLKHHAHSDCINIVTFKDGMDFYFKDRQPAVRFIDFLESHVPLKQKYSRKLVSANHKDNTGDFKHNYLVEIVPVCKDDLISLPGTLARNLSDFNPMCLVKTIGAGIHIIDPLTGERQELSSEKYWRQDFVPLMSSRDLVRFVVIDVEPIIQQQRASAKKRGFGKKTEMGEVTIAREEDLGVNDDQYICRTHLGHLMRAGDVVMGYDLTRATWAQEQGAEKLCRGAIPDIILVRKNYTEGRKERQWALRELEVDNEEDTGNRGKHDERAREADYESFMQEVEGDKEWRSQINLYKKTAKGKNTSDAAAAAATADGEDEEDDVSMRSEDEEEVRLDELLDDMGIDAAEEENRSAVIVSGEEEQAAPAGVDLGGTGFEPANFNMGAFNFSKKKSP
jgi:nonsense-mediated mRNA decay protein 3